jgi:hypothetical protein
MAMSAGRADRKLAAILAVDVIDARNERFSSRPAPGRLVD